MAIKKTVFERCRDCGEKQARQDEDGTVHFSHSCKQGAPGPPDYPRTFRPGEVIFMSEKNMQEIARQAMEIDDE